MSLTQKEYGNLRNLYSSVYTSSEVEITEEVTEELIDEVVDELVEELVTEGYDEEEAYSLVEEATDAYIDEAKVTFGHDTTARRASGAPVGARRKYGMRKAKEALSGAKKAAGGAYKTAKAKAAGAAVDASLAASAAKRKAGEAAKAVKDAPGKVRAAGSDAKKKAKSGIKGLIGRAAKKVASKASAVASRMSEEVEALKASGKFSEKEIEAFMNVDMSEGYKEIDAKKHGRMYDRYKKLRSAAIKDARDSGEASGDNRMKMGKMSAAIDKSSENLRKKQTKDQLTGRG